MDENSSQNNGELGSDRQKVEKLESDLQKIMNRAKSELPTKPDPQILTGAHTETVVTPNGVQESSKRGVPNQAKKIPQSEAQSLQVDTATKKNAQDPIPPATGGMSGFDGKDTKVVLWIAIVFFVLSMLILLVYIIGAKKEEGRRKVEETPLPIATSAPLETNTPEQVIASPSASTSPTGFLDESTPSSFLRTAIPSSTPGF